MYIHRCPDAGSVRIESSKSQVERALKRHADARISSKILRSAFDKTSLASKLNSYYSENFRPICILAFSSDSFKTIKPRFLTSAVS